METPIVQQHFEADPSIMYKLGSIEAQLRSINEKLDKKEKAQDEEIKGLKNDVTKLKEWRIFQLGAAAAISFVVGILTKVVSWPSLL